MGIFSKLFGHKNEEKVGGMEDYMTLVRVYFQAALASQLGITNLAMLPDLRVFKNTFHVPTVNNRLGIGEKAHVKKMMKGVDSAPVRPSSRVETKACGRFATIPAKMIRLMPLPMPRAVICSPSHIRNIVPPTRVITAESRKKVPPA